LWKKLFDLAVQVATASLDPNSVHDGYTVLIGSTYDFRDIKAEDEITIVLLEE
jgi:hypothetical protein